MLRSNVPGCGGYRFFDFALPAYEYKGFRTCPNAGVCKAFCYARQGRYTFKLVQKAQGKKLKLTLQNEFVAELGYQIAQKQKTVDRNYQNMFVRFNSSGDLYSPKYLNDLMYLAKMFPHVQFYTYSKMVRLVKSVELPKNFRVIFSYGGPEDKYIDPTKDHHAKVFHDPLELAGAGYTNCSHSDLEAWSTQKVGIVYHGVKKNPILPKYNERGQSCQDPT
jgi:hypothetical protein